MPVDTILRFLADPESGVFDELAATASAAPDPRLARAAVEAVLARSGVAGSERRPVLALAAEGESRLTDEILALRGDDAGSRPIKPRGVDPLAVRSWLASRQRDHRPALLVGPPAGLEGLLAPIERRGLKFRLPAGSSAVIVQKGAAPGEGLRARLIEVLGLTAERLWLGWEVEGVATPFVARWDGASGFAVPHWVRVELDDGGRLVVTDLATVGASPVQTGAPALIDGAQFVLP